MKVWWIKNKKVGVGEYNGTSVTKFTAGKTLRIHYTKKSNSISAIPSIYHEGVVAKVLEGLLVRQKDYQGAQYYANKWADAIRRGKQEANMGKDGSAIEVLRYDF